MNEYCFFGEPFDHDVLQESVGFDYRERMLMNACNGFRNNDLRCRMLSFRNE